MMEIFSLFFTALFGAVLLVLALTAAIISVHAAFALAGMVQDLVRM